MKTFELEISEQIINSLLFFLKKYPSKDYKIFEINKKKITEPIINNSIDFVSNAEQKEIEEELKDPDCNIVEHIETVEL